MRYDVAQLAADEIQRLMISAIVPRPIALVSTVADDGTPNLAPFSFFNGVCADPPIVSVSVGHRRAGPKDTLANVRATGELTIGTVTEAIATAMNQASGEYPPEVDEWEVAGLTPLPSHTVRPPRVAESPVNFECRLHTIVDVGDPPHGYGLILARIEHIHVRDEVLGTRGIDPEKLHAIGRLGGRGYTRTRDQFNMARPTVESGRPGERP